MIDQVADMGAADTVGIHVETFDPAVLARVAPAKARTGIEHYFAAWERAVARFGPGQVTTYVILGMGEDPGAHVEGCRRAIDLGVYPFVVPAPAGGGQPDGGLDAARPRPTVERVARRLTPFLQARGIGAEHGQGRLLALQRLLTDGRGRAQPAADRPQAGGRGPCADAHRLTWRSRPVGARRGAGWPTTRGASSSTTASATRSSSRSRACSTPTTSIDHDDDPSTIKVLGLHGREPAGAVRLFPLDAGRPPLAGRPPRRPAGPPSSPRRAPRSSASPSQTASEHGGQLMVAHIQLANVGLLRAAGLAVRRAASRATSASSTSRWPSTSDRRLAGDRRQVGDALDPEVDHVGGGPALAHAAGRRSRRWCPSGRVGETALGGRGGDRSLLLRRTAHQEDEAREADEPRRRGRRRRGWGCRRDRS